MLILIMSDTHSVDKSKIKMIVSDAINRGVELIIHPGDIQKEHIDAGLFGNLPVICALTENQSPMRNSDFVFAPANWCFTRPSEVDSAKMLLTDPEIKRILDQYIIDEEVSKLISERIGDANIRRLIELQSIADRIVNLGDLKIYVGHKRSYDVLTDSVRFNRFMNEVNQVCDGVSLICTGHTHHKFLIQKDQINWINPGAVMVMPAGVVPYDGYDYAIFNSDNNEVIFCHIPVVVANTNSCTVGIISDTGNISKLDEQYWWLLAEELMQRGTKYLICCGNHWIGDIGRAELGSFEIFYNLLPHQSDNASTPGNWHRINPDLPLVEIEGFNFLVQYNFGTDLSSRSEHDSLSIAKSLSRNYENRQIDFVVCGLGSDALFEDGGDIAIINPGDSRKKRKFATVCLPRSEITFGTVRAGSNIN